MKPGAVLCTECGYHTQQGVRFEAHKTDGVDIDMGTVALNKAEVDMEKAKRLQSDMISGAGMPPWLLALILAILVGMALIGVIGINMARRAETTGTSNSFNTTATFLAFTGICFNLASLMMSIRILIHAFKNDMVKGLLTLFVPFYMFYYVIMNWKGTGKSFIILVITTLCAIGCFVGAQSAM